MSSPFDSSVSSFRLAQRLYLRAHITFLPAEVLKKLGIGVCIGPVAAVSLEVVLSIPHRHLQMKRCCAGWAAFGSQLLPCLRATCTHTVLTLRSAAPLQMYPLIRQMQFTFGASLWIGALCSHAFGAGLLWKCCGGYRRLHACSTARGRGQGFSKQALMRLDQGLCRALRRAPRRLRSAGSFALHLQPLPCPCSQLWDRRLLGLISACSPMAPHLPSFLLSAGLEIGGKLQYQGGADNPLCSTAYRTNRPVYDKVLKCVPNC